jgi:hypothetical protein
MADGSLAAVSRVPSACRPGYQDGGAGRGNGTGGRNGRGSVGMSPAETKQRQPDRWAWTAGSELCRPIPEDGTIGTVWRRLLRGHCGGSAGAVYFVEADINVGGVFPVVMGVTRPLATGRPCDATSPGVRLWRYTGSTFSGRQDSPCHPGPLNWPHATISCKT